MVTKVTPNILKETIVKIQRNNTLPTSAKQFQQVLHNSFHMTYSQQYVKTKINELVAEGKLELVGKIKKTELFSLPGQPLDPWQSTVTHRVSEEPLVKINDTNYSIPSLINEFKKAHWSPFNDSTNESTGARLTLLLLGNSVDDILSRSQISKRKHLVEPLMSLSSNLKQMATIIDSVVNSHDVSTGNSGNAVSDELRREALDAVDNWLSNLSINLRSNVDSER